MAVEKPFNSGQWTQARMHSFVMSALRRAQWPPKYAALKAASVGKRRNPASGRMANHFKCAKCGEAKPQKEMAVDHIIPVIPVTGFDSWNEVIKRLFVEVKDFQVLCKKPCHQEKTKEENAQRRANKKK